MATTPNEYRIKGKLQIVLDGHDEPMELGEIEIPVRVDFHKPTNPGAVYRGNPGILNLINESFPTGSVG